VIMPTSLSTLSGALCRVGLPYQILMEEAQVVGVKMRLEKTLGTVPFRSEYAPRFRTGRDGTIFTSAVKQGLAMFHMGLHK
jgi:hypothetical protein